VSILANPDGAETLLMTTPPEATAEDAVSIARRFFGVEAAARVLTSERDRNFHLTAPDGGEFVLKIANSAEDPRVTNLQTEALRHIESRNPGLPAPRIRAALDGRFEIELPLPNGSIHLVRLLTFLPGEPLHRTASSADQRAELGRRLAEIGLALSDFRHPAAHHELLWDLKHVQKLRALLPHIADAKRRALATETLDNHRLRIEPRLASFRSQIVHNDFNPHNVLVDPADPTRVTGVLDFGDIVETQLVNDVAIAASYLVEGEDPVRRVAEFVGAYHSLSRLLPDEIDALYDLMMLRQLMTIAITEWRASLHPDNKAYILRNHPRAAAALQTLADVGRDRATAALRRACEME
jgi:Ser/Thr protein kinase RdoA (MazF antagonist)